MAELLGNILQHDSCFYDARVQWGLFAGAVGFSFFYRKIMDWKNGLPPGPMPLPLIGNLLSCRSFEMIHKNFAKWAEQYGAVFTIYLGPSRFIVLADPNILTKCLVTQGQTFAGRMRFPSLDIFTHGGKDITFAQPTPVWKLQRQIAHNAIRKYASGPKLERTVARCVASLNDAVSATAHGEVDIPQLMLKLTYNFLASVSFGKEFGFEDPWLQEMMATIQTGTDTVGSGFISDFIPCLKFLDRNKFRVLEKVTKDFDEILLKEYEEHEQTFDPEDPRDLTDEILVQLQKQRDDPAANPVLGQLTQDYLIQILIDLFFAGTDATRITLSMVIGLLVQHPEIQAKLQRELDSVLGEADYVTLNELHELPYTKAVVHETMRFHAVAPLGIPHRTTADTTIGLYTPDMHDWNTYHIPKGTNVITNLHGIHRLEGYWEDADVFKPEHWLDRTGGFTYHSGRFFAFSAGPRMCAGSTLARNELAMFVALLFKKYEFKAMEGETFVLRTKESLFGVDTEAFSLILCDRDKRNA